MRQNRMCRFVVADIAVRSGSDGRTVEAVCVPFGLPTEVSDGGAPYMEAFDRSAFDEQFASPGAARMVSLKWNHGRGVTDYLGEGVAFEARPDHLLGVFRAYESDVVDHALALMQQASNLGMSVGFRPLKSAERGGVVWRERAHLTETSATPDPAYPNTMVLAVRNGQLVQVDDGDTGGEVAEVVEEKVRWVPSAQTRELLARLNLEVPGEDPPADPAAVARTLAAVKDLLGRA